MKETVVMAEGTGGRVVVGEEEAREIAGRVAGSQYSLDEVNAAIVWARNQLAHELGTDITIQADCETCRRPLNTHVQGSPCEAEQVEDAYVYVTRQLNRLRDALAAIDARRGNNSALEAMNSELRRQLDEFRANVEAHEREIARLRRERDEQNRHGAELIIHANEQERWEAMEAEADAEGADLLGADGIDVEDHYDTVNESHNLSENRRVVVREEATSVKTAARGPEDAAGARGERTRGAPAHALSPPMRSDPSSDGSDSSSSSSSSSSEEERRRRKRRWRKEGRRRSSSSRDERRRRKKKEKVIVPKRAKKVRDDKVVKVYPGLEDLPPDSPFELRHMTTGKICGGAAVPKTFRDLLKVVEYLDFDKKTNPGDSSFMDYIHKERQFFLSMENASTEETTIYDFVAVFAEKMRTFRHSIRPLKRKVAHFTSFAHFLREYRESRWPNYASEGMIEVEKCAQRREEDISQYYERFCEIRGMAAWPPEALIAWFVSGLHNHDVRHEVQMRQFPVKTLEAVRDCAIELTGLQKVADAMDKRRGNRPHAQSQASAAPSNRRQAKASTASASASAPQASAATQGAIPKRPQNGDGGPAWEPPEVHAQWVARKERAMKFMKDNNYRGCPACACFHRFKKSYKGCRPVCPICDVEFKEGDKRHWWTECRKMPKSREQILEKFKGLRQWWKKE